MIPKRQPSAIDEVRLDDEDILDAQPVASSGTHRAARAAPPPPPPPRSERRVAAAPSTPADAVVMRLMADSIVDGLETKMSDVTVALARLSVGASKPALCGAVEWNDLAPHEAWVVSVISAGFDVQAIIETSPLAEEDTLTLLGRLVSAHVITVRPPA